MLGGSKAELAEYFRLDAQADEEIASGTHDLEPTFPRTGPRSARSRPHTPLPRRSSASNMQEQSASKGLSGARRSAREPAPVNRWSPTHDAADAQNGCRGDELDRSGDEGPTASLHSQEGDTEAANVVCLQIILWLITYSFSQLLSVAHTC